MVETIYKLRSEKITKKVLFAVASDLHNYPAEKAIESLKKRKPDMILMPGDIFDTVREETSDPEVNSLDFLEAAGKIAPCYFSIGNHDWKVTDRLKKELSARDVVLLDDQTEQFYMHHDRFAIGGLTSPCGRVGIYSRWETPAPDLRYLDAFGKEKGFRVLLSHHPEFYEPYIRRKNIDLIVSGHAHGGQVRLFGHGLFAPGQGILPKYTEGMHDGRLVISRGLGNGAPAPRLFNPYEMVYIQISPQ